MGRTLTSGAGAPPGRIAWIDVARGVGIVLVSFGHLRNGDGQSVWLPALDPLIGVIYLFHMPLFFLLGGVTFSRRGGWRSFLMRKVRTLLVPYYVFSLYFLAKPLAVLLVPSVGATFRTGHDYDIARQCYDVLIAGEGLWFLMAFFCAQIMMYAITAVCGANRAAMGVTAAAMIVFSYAQGSVFTTIALPFQLWMGVRIAGFMCVGYLCRGWLKALDRRRAAWLGGGLLAVTVALGVPFVRGVLPDGAVWVCAMAAALTGAFAVTLLCVAVHDGVILARIGRDSLVYYALNALTLNIMKLAVFRVLGLDASAWPPAAQFGVGVAVSLGALALLWAETWVVRHAMWWAIGESRPARGSRLSGGPDGSDGSDGSDGPGDSGGSCDPDGSCGHDGSGPVDESRSARSRRPIRVPHVSHVSRTAPPAHAATPPRPRHGKEDGHV